MTAKSRSAAEVAPRRTQEERRAQTIEKLLGATAALGTVARRSLAADPSGPSGKPSGAEARFVYVGTYTAPGVPPGGTHPSTAVGIYVFTMDPSDGGLTLLQIVPASNPSFVALDP